MDKMGIQASSLPDPADRDLGQTHSFLHKRKALPALHWHPDGHGSSWDQAPGLEKGLPCVLGDGEWSQQESRGISSLQNTNYPSAAPSVRHLIGLCIPFLSSDVGEGPSGRTEMEVGKWVITLL